MGALSESEKEGVLAKIRQQYKGCPDCSPIGGGSSMGDIVALSVVEKGIPSGLTLGSQFIPAIPITCNSCGRITFFAAGKYTELGSDHP